MWTSTANINNGSSNDEAFRENVAGLQQGREYFCIFQYIFDAIASLDLGYESEWVNDH